MRYAELIILLPCHSFEDFPYHHEGEEADGLLASFTALWHPRLLATAGQMPQFRRADDPAGVFDQLTPEMVGEMRDQRVAFIRKVAWPTLAAGALMTALALVLRRAPVLLSLLAGAVYVVVAGVLMAVDVTTLLQDLVVKAVTLLGLFRVVSCAMAYELGRPEPPAGAA